MLKKIIVLAMALGVVAAFALPATAGAAWKHKGLPIQQAVDLDVTGTNVKFQSSVGGVECQTISTVTFNGPGQEATTGKADSFKPHPGTDTQNCKGFGGLAPCQIHNLTPTGVSPHGTGWVLHTSTNPNRIQITVGEIHSQATGFFCPFQNITLTAGNVEATPEQEPVKTLNLSGQLEGHLWNSSQPTNQTTVTTTISGVLHVLGEANGTYEI